MTLLIGIIFLIFAVVLFIPVVMEEITIFNMFRYKTGQDTEEEANRE